MTDFRGLCQCTNTWAFQEPLEKPLTFGSNVTSFGQSALLLKTDFSSVLMAVNVSGNCSARRYTTTPHSSLESFPRSSGIHRISERTLLKTYFSIQLHLLSDKKTAVLFRSHSTSLWCRRWPQGHMCILTSSWRSHVCGYVSYMGPWLCSLICQCLYCSKNTALLHKTRNYWCSWTF